MVRLISGGARSGKSRFAEKLYGDLEDVVYIATSKITDKEMEERVALHRESRPSLWRTFEGSHGLTEAIGSERYYLLDCVTVLISNIMFEKTKDKEYIDSVLQKEVESAIMDELRALIDEINNVGYTLTLVTNEVGLGIVPENHLARVFRDIQGRINQQLGQLSDEVYLVCCGIPVKIK